MKGDSCYNPYRKQNKHKKELSGILELNAIKRSLFEIIPQHCRLFECEEPDVRSTINYRKDLVNFSEISPFRKYLSGNNSIEEQAKRYNQTKGSICRDLRDITLSCK